MRVIHAGTLPKNYVVRRECIRDFFNRAVVFLRRVNPAAGNKRLVFARLSIFSRYLFSFISMFFFCLVSTWVFPVRRRSRVVCFGVCLIPISIPGQSTKAFLERGVVRLTRAGSAPCRIHYSPKVSFSTLRRGLSPSLSIRGCKTERFFSIFYRHRISIPDSVRSASFDVVESTSVLFMFFPCNFRFRVRF